LIIGIEDQGDGFDWESKTNSIPAPDAESGRGLAIIKHHTGEIQHNKKGNKMTLKIFT
jgi:anti-sigma regulatory factor (Ser/Thr protein kinase)